MRHIISGLIFALVVSLTVNAEEVDLSGRWRLLLGPEAKGVDLVKQEPRFTNSVHLPGSLQEQGFGERPRKDSNWTTGIGLKLLDDPRFQNYVERDEFQCPFWLTPDRVYVGAAYYQREFRSPRDWDGKRVVLFLERPHWETAVWIDGRAVGAQNSLGVAHEYDVTEWITPGKKQRLAIRVDNGYVIPVGKDAHSISDQTQSNWNGITGQIKLVAGPKVWFDDVQIYPDLKNSQLKVDVKIGNISRRSGEGEISLSTRHPQTGKPHHQSFVVNPVEWDASGGSATMTFDMGDDWSAWSEYNPVLYSLRLELKQFGETIAQREASFGMRELSIEGKQFAINGNP
ncbi:beta-glucuronidase, partial [bacterium]|nr:beta-glucuronidase [bacterium]